MQRRVVVRTLFLAITIRISQGIYIHPENQTPTTSTTPPGGGTISSVLAYPPTTSGSNSNLSPNKHKVSNTTTPSLDYVSEEESAIYYEYETVNQTNVPDSTGSENEDEFCSFTLYVSSNSDKNSGGGGCKVQPSGDGKTQGRKGTVVSGGPRSPDLGLRKRLSRVERRLDLLERQLFRQSELVGKLQTQMFGLVQSDEGGSCEYNLGWVQHANSCYWFGKRHVSWEAARTICQAMGTNADLAVPSDESETKVLASYAQYYDPHYSWWLGCSQYEIGNWRCVDGQPLNYTNWRLDRPSNYDSHRCLQLGRPPKVDFVDTQCNQKWPFACEKPIRTLNQSS